MDEATSSKMLDDSFGTQIQNCLNVNAIKQVLLLHEHNITNKSQDIGRSVCYIGVRRASPAPIELAVGSPGTRCPTPGGPAAPEVLDRFDFCS